MHNCVWSKDTIVVLDSQLTSGYLESGLYLSPPGVVFSTISHGKIWHIMLSYEGFFLYRNLMVLEMRYCDTASIDFLSKRVAIFL